ncbi:MULTISPECIES: hypothetical protein [Paenibacillus]|uniref:Uncharacterized protein n=1 Tax=Paenibacillus tianjinensis TaxID=2810347 RepID=A0ABX7LCQ7_9BACL|nr:MULTISPECIES: hypothetical protein [Paenibacillus]QSF43772.1 hypothetical protein JRJ22_21315 [Paenibacillus tianjinensis]
MANESNQSSKLSREEREQIGRRTGAGFARVERTEATEGSTNIPTGSIGAELTEDEIRRLVGSGNFESAKNDRQSGSINS